jgi:hypothetical protein
MSWHEGPLQSWYDIHEALGNEITRLKTMAGEVSIDDADGLIALSEEVRFFADVLTVHSLAEDGVGFPILRHHGVDVPKELSEDHHRELVAVYEIRRACLELRFHDDDMDVAPALKRVRDGLAELEEDLLGHIESEDEHIIPLAAAKLSTDDQIKLVVKMVADIPSWLSAQLVPWMIETITRDHRVHLLKAWHGSMPPDLFAAKASLIRDGVEASLWSDLVAEIPELAELG